MGGGLTLEDRVRASLMEAAGTFRFAGQPLEKIALKELERHFRHGENNAHSEKLAWLNNILCIGNLYNSGFKISEIIERHAQNYAKVSKSTIYRRLNELENMGFDVNWRSKKRATAAMEKRKALEIEKRRESLRQTARAYKERATGFSMVKCYYGALDHAFQRFGDWLSGTLFGKNTVYAWARAYK